MSTIGICGAGTMGRGIAQIFAANGCKVLIYDLYEGAVDASIKIITKNYTKLVEKGKMTEAAAKDAAFNLNKAVFLNDLCTCDIVIEAVLEDFELKAKIFKELDNCCFQTTILASNTSSISVTQLAAVTKHPERVIGMHFFNPVPVMKLVEVIEALQTSSSVTKTVIELAKSVGKEPHISKDSYGFVVNRLLVPMINEAICVVAEGVATPADVDQMMKLGCNHPIGPLALADMIGLDVILNVMETLHSGFEDSKYRACTLLKKMVNANHLGCKTKKGFFDYL